MKKTLMKLITTVVLATTVLSTTTALASEAPAASAPAISARAGLGVVKYNCWPLLMSTPGGMAIDMLEPSEHVNIYSTSGPYYFVRVISGRHNGYTGWVHASSIAVFVW